MSPRPAALDGPDAYSTSIEHVAAALVRTVMLAYEFRDTEPGALVTFTVSGLGVGPGFGVGLGVGLGVGFGVGFGVVLDTGAAEAPLALLPGLTA